MREPTAKFYRVNAHAADHPFDDVAVVAKYAAWVAGFMAMVGSRLLSFCQITATNRAATALDGKNFGGNRLGHASSLLALPLHGGKVLFWGDGAPREGLSCCILLTGQRVLALFDLRSLSILLSRLLAAVVGSALTFALPLYIGRSPGPLTRLVGRPLLLSAVAFLHHVTQIVARGMMGEKPGFSNARPLNPIGEP